MSSDPEQPELRSKAIASLLRLGLGENTSPWLEARPGEAGQAGDRIGPYRLVSILGEGGFGVVWRAEQREPITREVAVKVIKPGMDSREIIDRFEGERQALAMMGHPHIAAVLDAGKTEAGQPWFAMELVRGLPITEYCDSRRLTLRQRLELFVPLCQAVQHAHQKGVLHRDLKPSNILVEETDGRPAPKVIDFGIAKALETGAEATHGLNLPRTRGLLLWGTPQYMSPEQAGLEGLDVDSRSDIYSLGAVLYELLTGSTPLSRETVAKAPAAEVLRLIREDDPPSMRRRVTSLESGTETVAKLRQTEGRRLSAQLRGDLEWIVTKALEKNRERRYSSAAALAEDVERHLRDEPVSAGPPSAAYRLGKLARRRKGPLAAAALVMLSLVAGLGFSIGQAVRATRAEQVAEARLSEMTREKQRADAEASRAEKQAAIAQAVSRFLQTDLLQQAGSSQQALAGFAPNPNLTVREALDRAALGIERRFAHEPLLEAAIRHTIGATYREIGAPESGIPHLRQAWALYSQELGAAHSSTLSCHRSLAEALSDVGEASEALLAIQEVRQAMADAFGPDKPETIRATGTLGTIFLSAHQPEAALPHCEAALDASRRVMGERHPDTLAAMNNLAGCLGQLGRTSEALSLLEAVWRLRIEVLGPDHPHAIGSRGSLGVAFMENGNLDEALPLLEGALEDSKRVHGDGHPQTPLAKNNLAVLLARMGRGEEAEALFVEALRLRKSALGPEHPETLSSMVALASSLSRSRRFPEAIGLLREALELARKNHGSDHPVTLRAMNTLGTVCWRAKDFESAITLFEEVLGLAGKHLGPAHPDTINILANLGVNYREVGREKEGKELLDEALRRVEEVPAHAAHRLEWIKRQRDRETVRQP